MPIRITGMNSGLDTESIITALTQKKKDKVDTYTGEQKKLTWKQDTLKALNKKVTDFYNGTLTSMKFSAAYSKKVTTASNANAVTIVTGENAMNATQTLDVEGLAKAAYLTGEKVQVGGKNAAKTTTMAELGIFSEESDESATTTLKFAIGNDPEDNIEVTIGKDDTIDSVLSKLRNAKSSKTDTTLNFNYDEGNGRFYVASKEMGEAASFKVTEGDAMSRLGFVNNGKNYIEGSRAHIVLNGEDYYSDSNTFEINGLTITVNEEAKGITLSTKQDTSGIFDNIKKLLKEYNDLMKEFATLYNADKAKKYKMLTDDQKDAMSDKEVEEWEKKIKDGILSGDETIGNIRNALKDIMSSSFEVTSKDGVTSKITLATFGIATGSYFATDENERDVLHIDGDKDDSASSGNPDLLSAAISTDPEMVQNFFMKLSNTLSDKLFDLMKGTQYSSAFTIYEDKLMASQYSAYTNKISDAQKALEAAQDKYYKKFSTMETALSKINSSSSSLAGFFGGGQ
ncbi:flagellar filament capping protein FliD [Butyrivibrio sp. M55]|uniref:flagellar filament capping protein FliD n=1 Tax=Butyrivibrio sp. M55 TaxID=1855323 RepID=UPI0008EBC66E|nr:flagellar filament capping protein FliD [Butyrivibrio sp. M55]SFU66299.1 flagellar hook-associated protein 2 [Butyrivibrio sp. M55]